MLTSAKLQDAGFAHGFSLRDAAIDEVTRSLGIEPGRLHQARQIHGRALVVADGHPEALAKIEADALMAEPRSGHAVSVRVADCVPVLLADPKTGRVAAVHAGWRGVEARIVDVAFEAMKKEPALLAAIGPCIGPCCFEVGADVADRIAKQSSETVIVRRAEREGEKAYVDLRRAVRLQLRALGIADSSIEDVPGCTRCDPERFHSYRRDGKDSGRLLGVIVAR
jgi:polyphenol oxidase